MAGDWIPIRTDLDEDPAVVGIASILNVSETQVIGWLWKFWSVASRQTTNGLLPYFTLNKVDGIVGRQGFAAALEAVAWLHRRSDSLEIPNFEHWLSESAKKRFQEAVKKRKQRLKNVPLVEGQMSPKSGDKKGTPVLSSPVLSSFEKEKGGVGEKGKTFCKPSIEEVKAYCLERKNEVDAERFIAYYESNGWRVGRNPMKSWKAAICSWEKNGVQNGSFGSHERGLGQVGRVRSADHAAQVEAKLQREALQARQGQPKTLFNGVSECHGD
jgi:hypothetical protein